MNGRVAPPASSPSFSPLTFQPWHPWSQSSVRTARVLRLICSRCNEYVLCTPAMSLHTTCTPGYDFSLVVCGKFPPRVPDVSCDVGAVRVSCDTLQLWELSHMLTPPLALRLALSRRCGYPSICPPSTNSNYTDTLLVIF